MHILFDAADRFIQDSSWKDLALVKFCLFAMGLLAGLFLPKKAKKPAFFIALAVFVSTYIPLMLKYARALARTMNGEEEFDF